MSRCRGYDIVVNVCIKLSESQCLILMQFKRIHTEVFLNGIFPGLLAQTMNVVLHWQRTNTSVNNATPYLFVEPCICESYSHAGYYLNIWTNCLFISFRPTQEWVENVGAGKLHNWQSVTWHERKYSAFLCLQRYNLVVTISFFYLIIFFWSSPGPGSSRKEAALFLFLDPFCLLWNATIGKCYFIHFHIMINCQF